MYLKTPELYPKKSANYTKKKPKLNQKKTLECTKKNLGVFVKTFLQVFGTF